MIKLVALFKRPEDIEAFDAHYNEVHAPLMRQVPGLERMEVTRNLNSLKRQAGKARRHRELSEELSTAKRALYKGRIVIAEVEQQAAEASVAEAQARESELAAQLAGDEATLAETRTNHAGRASRASSVREEMAGLNADVERLRSFMQQSETNLGDLLQRIANARSQIASLESEAAEQQQLLDEKTHALEAARGDRSRLREVSDQIERERQERSDEVRQHEKALQQLRESLMRTIAKISEARNQVHQIEIAVEKCDFYLTKLIESARKIAESRDRSRQTLSAWQQQLREAEAALVTAQRAARDAVARRDELTARRDAMRDSLAGARDRMSQTTYKIDSLRSLLTSLESQDEDVRRAILELIPKAASAAEAVSAQQGFETALDMLLREISKAVVVDDGETAVRAIERLRERGAGRGAFLIEGRRDAGTARGNAQFSVVGEGPIADAVRQAINHSFIDGFRCVMFIGAVLAMASGVSRVMSVSQLIPFWGIHGFSVSEFDDDTFRISTKGLRGADVFLDEPSVTGTENAVTAAVAARGSTILRNAASEPHVQDLCHFLVALGAEIDGIGTNKLMIEGGRPLTGATHTIGPDHIEVGSFIGLAAVTKSEIRIQDAGIEHLRAG